MDATALVAESGSKDSPGGQNEFIGFRVLNEGSNRGQTKLVIVAWEEPGDLLFHRFYSWDEIETLDWTVEVTDQRE